MPPNAMALIISTELMAGPIVQIIFVRMQITKVFEKHSAFKKIQQGRIMNRFIAAILSLSALVGHPLCAEIERVTVTWTAMECQANCIRQLEEQFRKIPGVAEVTMNHSAGQADLKWTKGMPFAFSPVNVAMELIGLTINDIRVKVHGVLQHTGNKVTLISTGDFTHFDLLNPAVPEVHGQAAQFNIAVRGLGPELLKKLMDAEKEKKTATIEGPLLMPERSPPLELVVSTLSFSESEKEKK